MGRIWLWALLAVLVPAPIFSQQRQPSFTLTASTSLVLVNVTARDRDGRLVADLKPGELTLSEDGVPQKLVSLDLEQPDASPPRDSTAATAVSPARTAAAGDWHDRRLIMLFFD